MKIEIICGCGLPVVTWKDWIAHFKYGLMGKWHAIKLMAKTRIIIRR